MSRASDDTILEASLEQVLAFRLYSHNLVTQLPHDSLSLAAGACGIQNTPPGSAGLALHARVADLTPGDVDHALAKDKSLLQAWSLRGAPYVFPTSDARVFTLGLRPTDEQSIRAFIFGVKPALDKIGISAEEAVRLAGEALVDRLDGRALTKDELGVELAEWAAGKLRASQLAAWRSPSWYAPGQSQGESVIRFCLPVLALQALCCHADRRGNKAFIARTDQWLGRPIIAMDPDEARAELIRRYLRCYGPSSVEHLAEWAGIGPAQACRAWRLVEGELVQVDFAGQKTWLHQEDMDRFTSPANPSSVRLLPPGDPFLALRDRATLVPDKAIQRQLWRTSGNPGVILAEGRLAAMWRPEKKGHRLNLAVESFTRLSRKTRLQIEFEAASLAPHKGCTSVEICFMDS